MIDLRPIERIHTTTLHDLSQPANQAIHWRAYTRHSIFISHHTFSYNQLIFTAVWFGYLTVALSIRDTNDQPIHKSIRQRRELFVHWHHSSYAKLTSKRRKRKKFGGGSILPLGFNPPKCGLTIFLSFPDDQYGRNPRKGIRHLHTVHSLAVDALVECERSARKYDLFTFGIINYLTFVC